MLTRQQQSSAVLAQTLAAVIPAAVAVYWLAWTFNTELTVMLFRPVIVVSCVGLFACLAVGPATRAEAKLLAVLGALCGAMLIPCFTASDPSRALEEWLKLLIICAVALMLCRALRAPTIARAFGRSLIVASVFIAVLIVVIYIRSVGLALPTYATTRVLKGMQSQMSMNAAAFECLFAYLCGMCLLRPGRRLVALGAGLLVICASLTGSRAPLAVLVVALAVLAILNLLRSPRLLVRGAGAVFGVACVFGLAVTIATTSPRELSTFSEGRWDLWTVAGQKFLDQPLWGHGYQSAQDDAVYLTGGYHNEYLTALAEQGVMGFLAVMVLFGFLMRACFRLAYRPFATWTNGQWALFACVFLFVRATIELPGLFGTAQGPADFLAYIFLAIVVSRESREEDHLLSYADPLATHRLKETIHVHSRENLVFGGGILRGRHS